LEIWHALLDILFLLLGALIIGALLERARQSAVVGFILAGMILGPHGLDAVESTDEVKLLAELGVSFLLFGIGLEFSRSKLARLRSASVLGVWQVIATAGLATAGCAAFGLHWRASVGLGLIVALSSTACVLRVLTDRAQLDSGPGRNALGVLLVQDVAVIPLAFAMEFLSMGDAGQSGVGPWALLGGAIGFGVGLWAVLHYLAPLLLGSRVLMGNRELALVLAVVSGLGAAAGAHAVGVSPALGAFIAGIVLAGSPFAVQIRSDVGALKTLLLTLFFGSVGMLADPRWMLEHLPELVGLLGALILLKTLVVAAVVRLVTGRWLHAVASGLALAQVGEFSFLLVELGEGAVVSAAMQPYLVSVILLSLLVTPYFVLLGGPIERWILRGAGGDGETRERKELASVLLVGYGPSGQRAAAEISRTGRRLLVLDLNSGSILRAREQGHLGTVGDAAHPEVLEHSGIEELELAVITLPDPNATERVIETVGRLRPGMPIVVRSRYHIHRDRFAHREGVRIVDEEEEVGARLGEQVIDCLRELGVASRRGGAAVGDATADSHASDFESETSS